MSAVIDTAHQQEVMRIFVRIQASSRSSHSLHCIIRTNIYIYISKYIFSWFSMLLLILFIMCAFLLLPQLTLLASCHISARNYSCHSRGFYGAFCCYIGISVFKLVPGRHYFIDCIEDGDMRFTAYELQVYWGRVWLSFPVFACLSVGD